MNKKGLLLILSAACLWGTAGIFVRALSGFGISNMQIVFVRAVITTLIMCGACLEQGTQAFKFKLRDVWLFVANGILSIVFFNFCYYKTIELSTLSVASVLMYTAPIFVMLLAIPIFKERLSIKKCICVLLAFLGCVFVSGAIGSGCGISRECLAFGLLTGLGYSLYTIFGNLLLNRGYSSLTITLYSFLFAALGSAPFALLGDGLPLYEMSGKAMLVAVAMAVFNTVLPYILYTAGLKRVEVSLAPIIATVEPITATVIGVFYNDPLDAYGVVGIILVLGSVIILNLKAGKKNEASRKCKD